MFSKKHFFISFFLVLLIPFSAFAASFRSDENFPGDEVIEENLYIAGSSPVIAGTVEGDLIAAGGNLTLTGNITKDALLAGGTVNITGDIEDDLRVVGGNIFIDGNVQGEVLVAGGDVKIGPNANIEGDFTVSAGDVSIDPKAQIKGEKRIMVDEKSRQNIQTQIQPVEFLFTFLMGLISVLIVGVLVFALTRKFMPDVFHLAFDGNNFWKSLGLGFAFLILAPVAIIITLVTGVGAFLGLILIFVYILYILFSIVFSGILFGGLLYKIFSRNKNSTKNLKNKNGQISWMWPILGMIILSLLNLVPVIGWLIGFIFFLAALGTLPRVKLEIWRKL